MLYASLHELVHHFAAFLVCGEFGYKSFNSFEAACESDAVYWFATLAGPLFSYIVMYVGAYFIIRGTTNFKKHLGFALIFAQLPMQRMTGPLLQQNDEWWTVWHVWGSSDFNWWITLIVIWLLCIPPMVVAYRAIKNKRKLLWFLLYFLLLPYILLAPLFLTLEYLMLEKNILSQTVIGIGLLFLINEIVTIIAYWFIKKYIDPFYSSNKTN
jgi:hypothetical protein